ncbi:hypothetical protein GSI_11332 [Ganoderma sinense ZZ0214-1]|uniref:Uncharacterized protein n=1 Tax=Ganoderma sinense ZZ0214-1 TaxID=1077348 RepID=A0A2G8RVP3_9APHY|nr:hypothetical protein GSI_11332 [Ganoderma sinense ZZ0214-1]
MPPSHSPHQALGSEFWNKLWSTLAISTASAVCSTTPFFLSPDVLDRLPPDSTSFSYKGGELIVIYTTAIIVLMLEVVQLDGRLVQRMTSREVHPESPWRSRRSRVRPRTALFATPKARRRTGPPQMQMPSQLPLVVVPSLVLSSAALKFATLATLPYPGPNATLERSLASVYLHGSSQLERRRLGRRACNDISPAHWDPIHTHREL